MELQNLFQVDLELNFKPLLRDHVPWNVSAHVLIHFLEEHYAIDLLELFGRFLRLNQLRVPLIILNLLLATCECVVAVTRRGLWS